MKKYLFAIFLLLFGLQPAFAETSCVQGYGFLGFSRDWEKAYWELQIAGECHYALALYEYNFLQNTVKLVADNQTDVKYYHNRPKIIQNLKKYDRKKRDLLTKVYSVPEETIVDLTGKPKGILGDNWFDVEKNGVIFKGEDGVCTFGPPRFEAKESDLTDIVSVENAYHNAKYDSWVVILNNCSTAKTPCYIKKMKYWDTTPSVAVYETSGCAKKARTK